VVGILAGWLKIFLHLDLLWTEDKGFVLSSELYRRMSTQRDIFNGDLNNSNCTKKCADFREGLAWSSLPNGRDP
jgi:hypothetical protein